MAAGLAGPQGEGVDACGVAMSSLGMKLDTSRFSMRGDNNQFVRDAHGVLRHAILAWSGVIPYFDPVLVGELSGAHCTLASVDNA